MKLCVRLFWEMFKIASCVMGGGFAILAVADERFSRKMKWTEEGEIVKSLPVLQMVPGIIAGNTAIYVGRKLAGVPGAVSALLGVMLPSVAVFSAVSAGYAAIPVDHPLLVSTFLGLRAALAGIIAAMIVRSWRDCVAGWTGYALLAISLAAICRFGLNPALVVAACAALGVATAMMPRRVASRRFFSSIWALPLIFLKYGSIAFGGGYVLVPAYIRDFVGTTAQYLQLAHNEFANVMALTQATPGPISVNCATFFGFRMGMEAFGSTAGAIACALLATICIMLPGAILLYLALGSLERFKSSRIVKGLLAGVRPVTIAMMLNALWCFLGMSVWSPADGDAPAAFRPLALVIAVAVGAAVRFKLAGVVKLMIAASIAAILLRLG